MQPTVLYNVHRWSSCKVSSSSNQEQCHVPVSNNRVGQHLSSRCCPVAAAVLLQAGAFVTFLLDLQVKILGKCEFANPSGSIKDRIADHIMNMAEQQGKLKPGGTVVAATSGNTGASVAMIAAMKGYHYIGE